MVLTQDPSTDPKIQVLSHAMLQAHPAAAADAAAQAQARTKEKDWARAQAQPSLLPLSRDAPEQGGVTAVAKRLFCTAGRAGAGAGAGAGSEHGAGHLDPEKRAPKGPHRGSGKGEKPAGVHKQIRVLVYSARTLNAIAECLVVLSRR